MRSQSKQKGTVIAPRLVNQKAVFANNLSDGRKAQNDTLQEFSIEKRTQATEHANNDFPSQYGSLLTCTSIIFYHG